MIADAVGILKHSFTSSAPLCLRVRPATNTMASRLRSSLFRLLTGERTLVSAKEMVVSPLRLHTGRSLSRSLYYTKASSSFQFKGSESLKRLLHTSGNLSDDEFDELGDPVEEDLPISIKLKTEKPDAYRNQNGKRKVSSNSSSKERAILSCNDASSEVGNGFAAHGLRLKDQNEGRSSNSRISRCITIENVPSIIKPSQVKEALSVFGTVSVASIRSVENGLDCCDVEFQSSESREKAIEAGTVIIGDFNLPIRPVHVFRTISIRINNISAGTPDSKIHSVFTSCGPLEGFRRPEQDTVDAFFKVRNKSDLQRILKKLNGLSVNRSQWSANVQPDHPTPVAAIDDEEEAQRDLELINRHVDEFKREVIMKKIHIEDLSSLHDHLVHLESSSHGNMEGKQTPMTV